jgi:hypothetical protein
LTHIPDPRATKIYIMGAKTLTHPSSSRGRHGVSNYHDNVRAIACRCGLL